jgi:hypothetical protein
MAKEKKETLNVHNFGKDNTPAWAAKIGNGLLIAGGVGATILTLPVLVSATVPGLVIVLPPLIHSIGTGLTVLGVFGKLWSKLKGEIEIKEVKEKE